MTEHFDNESARPRRRAWLRRHEVGLTFTVLAALFVIALFWGKIVISIPAGHRGIHWSRVSGTLIDRVYPEGLHVILPWDSMTLYDVRYQTIDDTLTILSRDGLPVDMELTMRFKPSDRQLGLLHADVGPSYATTIVVPEVAAAVRAVIGNLRPEELYALGFEAIQQEINEYAGPQTGIRHVVLDDVLIRKISLPDEVVASIERKFQQEQASQEMVYRLARERQEAERKEIEAGGIRTYNQLVSETLTTFILQNKGIEATLQLAESENAKVVVVGGGSDGLPLILNTDGTAAAAVTP